jgi:hypothetical protein
VTRSEFALSTGHLLARHLQGDAAATARLLDVRSAALLEQRSRVEHLAGPRTPSLDFEGAVE